MKLTKYKEISPCCYYRKIPRLESLIFCRNSKLRMWFRRTLNIILKD